MTLPDSNSTPTLAEVTLPPVVYSEEAQALIEQLVYRFPTSACCGERK